MEKSQHTYLVTIGITQPIIDRIAYIMDTFASILLEPIKALYLSEYMTGAGERVLESVWLISENYMFEMKEFINKEIIDITPYYRAINYCLFEKENYDMTKGVPKSQLTISFTLEDDTRGTLKGSGINCDYLLKIYEEFIKPNIE